MGSFTTGVASNHRDLFDQIYNFLTGNPAVAGQDWTSRMHENTKDNSTGEPFGSNCKQCVLSNDGESGTEVVIIGIRCWEYSAGAAYGFDLNGYITWTVGQRWNDNSGDTGLTTYNSTWGRWEQHPMIPLMNNNMTYWIFSNRQRVVLVVQTSSDYQSAYMGFGNRFGSPSEYPYPLLILAPAYGNITYTNQTAQHTFMLRPYITSNRGAVLCVDPGNLFSTQKTSMGGFELIPSSSDYQDPAYYNYFTRGDYDYRKFIFPVYAKMDGQLLMSLDGVGFNFCDNMNSQDVFIQGGTKHYLFQNNHRITWADFAIVNSEVAGTTTTTTTTSSSTTTTTTAP